MTGKRKISTLLRPSCTIQQSIEKGCVHTKSVTALPSHFEWDALWYSCNNLSSRICPALEVEPSSAYGCQSHLSAIWYQHNPMNYTTQLLCWGPLMFIMWDPTTATNSLNNHSCFCQCWIWYECRVGELLKTCILPASAARQKVQLAYWVDAKKFLHNTSVTMAVVLFLQVICHPWSCPHLSIITILNLEAISFLMPMKTDPSIGEMLYSHISMKYNVF